MVAVSEAPRDPRQYIRITTDIAMNPKLAVIDDPAASWTYVCSIAYSGGSLTDGHFPIAAVLRLAGTSQEVAKALAEQELWHLPGHDCSRCPQPKRGHAYVHDFLQHQRSKDEVQDLTDKRREAGRAGAAARWGVDKPPGKRIANEAANEHPLWDEGEASMASAMANAKPSAMANAWQTDGKAIAEERRGEERRTIPPTAGDAGAIAVAVTDPGPEPRSAQEIVAWWIDRCDQRPPGRIVGQMAKHIKELLDEGFQPVHIRQGIGEWAGRGQHPSSLQSFVSNVANRHAPIRAAPPRESTTNRAVADALALADRLEAQGGSA